LNKEINKTIDLFNSSTFETDEERTYFMAFMPLHPALVQRKLKATTMSLKKGENVILNINENKWGF